MVIEHIHPEGEPTPTLRDLYDRKDGSVEVVEWSQPKGKPAQPSKFRLTAKGHQVLGEIMARNAAATLQRGTGKEEAVARLVREATHRTGRKSNGGKST